MKNIMVVYDGTDASRILYEIMQDRVCTERLDARVLRHNILRSSESGLSSGYGISEFRGVVSDLVSNVRDIDLLLIHLAPVSREVIDAAPNLRFVGTERSSLPNIDVAYARERGIRISYAEGRNARTVAEFTLGLILSVTRHICTGHRLVSSGQWSNQLDRRCLTGIEIEGKRIGLYGMGEIAKQLVRILSGFGADLVYYDPYQDQRFLDCRPVDRDELLSTSDIISLHARSNSNAECLLTSKDIHSMKKGAFFVNTSRGNLVDEGALIDALQCGDLGGVALDVYSQEPLSPDSPWLTIPNAVLCPHIAGLSRDMGPRSAHYVAEDTIRFLKGEPLLHEYGN